jgi:mono/diheme cytochrome c family protein
MKNFIFGFAAALLLIPAVGLACFAFGFTEIRSDMKPSALETRIMSSAVHNSVRRSASNLPAPPPAANEAIIAGGKLYAMGCMGCHGELGKPFHEDLVGFPPAPQLPHAGTQYSEPELYWIVKHGIRATGMSAYGPFYSEQQLWNLAAFLRQINNLPPETIATILKK